MFQKIRNQLHVIYTKVIGYFIIVKLYYNLVTVIRDICQFEKEIIDLLLRTVT